MLVGFLNKNILALLILTYVINFMQSVDGGLEVSIGNSVEVMKNGDASAENVVQV
jgi:hypothetical protein